jgi:hypothetical protein
MTGICSPIVRHGLIIHATRLGDSLGNVADRRMTSVPEITRDRKIQTRNEDEDSYARSGSERRW